MIDNIDIGNLATTLADDHIRQAIMHINSYLCTWWKDEEYAKKEKILSPIIEELDNLIS